MIRSKHRRYGFAALSWDVIPDLVVTLEFIVFSSRNGRILVYTGKNLEVPGL